jgi:hypothetical protein
VYFTKPASNTIIRSFDHRFPLFIAADNMLGAKRDADPASFTPVSKDRLIVQLPLFSGWLFSGYLGLFRRISLLDGLLLGPFAGWSHSPRLNMIVFAGLSTASVSSR